MPGSFVMQLRRPFAFVIEALGRLGHQIPVMMPARLARQDAAKPVPEAVRLGPFIFQQKEWRPGDVASFVPNPRYRPRPEAPDGLAGGKVVKLDRVDLVSIADQTTRTNALETGEIDWLEIAPMDYVASLRANRGIVVGKPRGMDQFLAVLNVNHADPPFNNTPPVRKALQAAIVQPEIVAAVGLPDDSRHAVLRLDLHVQCARIDGCRHRGAEERRHGTGAPAPEGVGIRRRARRRLPLPDVRPAQSDRHGRAPPSCAGRVSTCRSSRATPPPCSSAAFSERAGRSCRSSPTAST